MLITVSRSDGSLTILDNLDPTNLSIKDQIRDSNTSYAQCVAINHPYIFIGTANGNGFNIYDMTDPENVILVSHTHTDPDDNAEFVSADTWFWDHEGIILEGDYAYILDGSEGLFIMDVSDVENPSFVGFEPTGRSANTKPVKVGDYIYATDGSGVAVWDVSDVENPVFVNYGFPVAKLVYRVGGNVVATMPAIRNGRVQYSGDALEPYATVHDAEVGSAVVNGLGTANYAGQLNSATTVLEASQLSGTATFNLNSDGMEGGQYGIKGLGSSGWLIDASLWLSKVGNPGGNITFKVYQYSGGDYDLRSSWTLLDSKVCCAAAALVAGENTVTFDAPIQVTNAVRIVAMIDTADVGNYIRVGRSNTNVQNNAARCYTNGIYWVGNPGDGPTVDAKYRVHYQAVPDKFTIYRAGLAFSTPSIPGGASVELWVHPDFLSGSGWELTVVDGSGLGEDLVTSDYGVLGDAIASFGSGAVDDMNDDEWDIIELNGSGVAAITEGGTTIFGLRSDQDIDSSEPAGLEYMGLSNRPGADGLTALDESTLIVVDSSNELLQAVDISANPIIPTLLSEISGDAFHLAGARVVIVIGDYAIIGMYYDNGSESSLTIINISDLENMTYVSHVDDKPIAQYTYAMASRGNHVYLGAAGATTHLAVVDISDINNPAIVESFGSYGSPDYMNYVLGIIAWPMTLPTSQGQIIT